MVPKFRIVERTPYASPHLSKLEQAGEAVFTVEWEQEILGYGGINRNIEQKYPHNHMNQ